MKLDFDFINRKIINWSIEPKIDDLRFFHVCVVTVTRPSAQGSPKKFLNSETQ